MLRAAEREDALLGARLLLVAARAADRGVEAVLVQRLLQRLGLHHVGVHGGAVADRADALRDAVGVDVHAQRRRRSRRRGGRGTRSSRGTSSRCRRAAAGSAAAPVRTPCTSRCSSTELSLPIEYSMTGLRNSAATSRRMWMLSASSRSRWLRANGFKPFRVSRAVQAGLVQRGAFGRA